MTLTNAHARGAGSLCTIVVLCLTACGGQSGADTNSSAVSTEAPSVGVSSWDLSGSPSAIAHAGSAYSFKPTVIGTSQRRLTFSVKNLPRWAMFDTTTGALTGTPDLNDTGTDSNLVISATDGSSNAALQPFNIVVQAPIRPPLGTLTVTWRGPSQNIDGSNLSNLFGYRIHYGKSPTQLNESVDVPDPSAASYELTNLSAGIWYFAVSALNSDSVESEISSIAVATI